MSPMQSTIERLQRQLQSERVYLLFIQRQLHFARSHRFEITTRKYELQLFEQFDRVWHAQETLKAFNPSFTMVPEPA